MIGRIYVLATEDLPGIVKIGYTTNSAQFRASQISSNYKFFSTRSPFVPVFDAPVSGIHAEHEAHKLLVDHMLPTGVRSELFQIDIEQAIDVVSLVAARNKPRIKVDRYGLWSTESGSGAYPKRSRIFESKYRKAKSSIRDRVIQPKTREISKHCKCAYRTSLNILRLLCDEGVLSRAGRNYRINPT